MLGIFSFSFGIEMPLRQRDCGRELTCHHIIHTQWFAMDAAMDVVPQPDTTVEIELGKEEIERPSEELACLICQEEQSNMLIVQPCEHGSFCRACLQTYMHHKVQMRLHSGKMLCPFKIPPNDFCTTEMSDDFVFSVMENEEDVEKYKRWKKLSTEPILEHPMADLELMEDGALKHSLKNSKPCPKCRTPIEKKSGCDHLRCPLCGTDFCFRCGEPCVSGTYLRKCGKCNREFIDHLHTPEVRRCLCFSTCFWLPLALLYLASCVACVPFCCCLAITADGEETPMEEGNDAAAKKEGNPKPTNVQPDPIIPPLDHTQRRDGKCTRVTKMVFSVLFAPFIVVCQFSGLHSCMCLMDPQMMEGDHEENN